MRSVSFRIWTRVAMSNSYDDNHYTRSTPSSPFINPSVTVPRAPITIGINDALCSTIFQFPSKVMVLILLFTFFYFYSLVSRDSKTHCDASSLFFVLIIIKSGRLEEIRWSVCMSKSHRSLCVSFSRQMLGRPYTSCLYGEI